MANLSLGRTGALPDTGGGRLGPPLAQRSPVLPGAAAGWAYLPQPLAQLGTQLELLGVAQTLKGQLGLLALQIGLSQLQILHLLFPGRGETEQSFMGYDTNRLNWRLPSEQT